MKLNNLLKAFFFTLPISLLVVAAHAQDKIYKKDGTVIDAKVKTVGQKTVTYKRTDNLDGPEYTILESDIARIVYPNGKTDMFEGFDKSVSRKKGHHKGAADDFAKGPGYGKNIFSITPIAYTISADGTINDVGIGIGYERLLDKHGHIGFILPIMIGFSSSKDYDNATVNVSGANLTYGSYTSVYFMPGVKFYPAPDRLKVRYSIGASFFCIFGGEPAAVHDPNSPVYNPTTGTSSYPTGTYRYSMYGLMLSNSINITATKHLFMSIDLGAGVPFSDNRYANGNGLGIPVPFLQVGFKIGYRYGS